MCTKKDAEAIVLKLRESSEKAQQLADRVKRHREHSPSQQSAPPPKP